eukprot:g788.t1
MSFYRSCRKLHGCLAMLAGPLFIFVIATGLSWSIAFRVLHFAKGDVKWLLELHQMSVLGLEKVFPLLVGTMLVVMLLTGLPRRGWLCCPPDFEDADTQGWCLAFNTFRSRRVHKQLSLAVGLWILWTSLTASTWCIVYRWLGWPKEDAKVLLRLHDGSFWGFPATYCMVLGVACLTLACTGMANINCHALKVWESTCKPTQSGAPPPTAQHESNMQSLQSPLLSPSEKKTEDS